jgi:hypothetical protein
VVAGAEPKSRSQRDHTNQLDQIAAIQVIINGSCSLFGCTRKLHFDQFDIVLNLYYLTFKGHHSGVSVILSFNQLNQNLTKHKPKTEKIKKAADRFYDDTDRQARTSPTRPASSQMGRVTAGLLTCFDALSVLEVSIH